MPPWKPRQSAPCRQTVDTKGRASTHTHKHVHLFHLGSANNRAQHERAQINRQENKQFEPSQPFRARWLRHTAPSVVFTRPQTGRDEARRVAFAFFGSQFTLGSLNKCISSGEGRDRRPARSLHPSLNDLCLCLFHIHTRGWNNTTCGPFTKINDPS